MPLCNGFPSVLLFAKTFKRASTLRLFWPPFRLLLSWFSCAINQLASRFIQLYCFYEVWFWREKCWLNFQYEKSYVFLKMWQPRKKVVTAKICQISCWNWSMCCIASYKLFWVWNNSVFKLETCMFFQVVTCNAVFIKFINYSSFKHLSHAT